MILIHIKILLEELDYSHSLLHIGLVADLWHDRNLNESRAQTAQLVTY